MKKALRDFVLLVVLVFNSFTTFAAEKDDILAVRLIVNEVCFDVGASTYRIDIDGEMEDRYDVSSVAVTNIPDQQSGGWQLTSQPILKIIVNITDTRDYRFSGVEAGNVSITGAEGEVLSVSCRPSSVTILYKLQQINLNEETYRETELVPDDVLWEKTTGTARWYGAADAAYYEVRLYRGDSLVKAASTAGSAYNFSDCFTEGGQYYFTVQAYHKDSTRGACRNSERWYVDRSFASYLSSMAQSLTAMNLGNALPAKTDSLTDVLCSDTTRYTAQNGCWIEDAAGFWYQNPDGSYPYNGFASIGGQWYYFDMGGRNVRDRWINWKSKYYYLGKDGAMLRDAMTPDGYYVNASGVWDTSYSSVRQPG